MGESGSRAEPYVARFRELRAQLVPVLGAKTVDLIIERGAVEIGGAYPEMNSVRCVGDDAVDLSQVESAMEGKTDAEIGAAFEALSGVVMLIIARLLGKEVAMRLVHSGNLGGGQRRGAG